MAKQYIDTVRIDTTINKLKTVNKNINNKVSILERNARTLNSWKGSAGEKALTKLYELLEGNTTRSAVLENYINMLEHQINPGYIEAEKVNTKLADMFK